MPEVPTLPLAAVSGRNGDVESIEGDDKFPVPPSPAWPLGLPIPPVRPPTPPEGGSPRSEPYDEPPLELEVGIEPLLLAMQLRKIAAAEEAAAKQQSAPVEEPWLAKRLDQLSQCCKGAYRAHSRLVHIVAAIVMVLFCAAALGAAIATAPSMGPPEPRDPGRGMGAVTGSRKALLGYLDTMCFFPPCVSKKDANPAATEIGTGSSGLGEASSTLRPQSANTSLRRRPKNVTWMMIGQNAFCSFQLSKSLSDYTTSVAKCKEVALVDADCSHQIYANGVDCNCVLANHTCDFQPSTSGNSVYQWQDGSVRVAGSSTTTRASVPTTDTNRSPRPTTTRQHRVEVFEDADAFDEAQKNSLFCFMLVVPWGREHELVTWQHKAHKGIFNCDQHAVYSNTTNLNLNGVQVQVVQTDLHCPIGGQWNTRLNTPIFIKLWQQVVRDGQYSLTSWTVKADPDAVFLPQRLRDVVESPSHRTAQEGNGVFADNCEYRHSLHGPLELLSRRALEVYSLGHQEHCEQPPQEDVYMRACLLKLGVKVLNDYNILAEEYCFWDWRSCKSGRVAFHPFKTLHGQWDCFANAEKFGDWHPAQG